MNSESLENTVYYHEVINRFYNYVVIDKKTQMKEPERNFERAHKMIVKAKAEGCDLIVLPETIDFAWTHPSSLKEAKAIPGEYSDFFCQWSKENNIYICVGLTEKGKDANHNTALLINNSGKIILKYSKINLLTVEFPYYQTG